MTAPAITISPNATIPAATRLMNTHHVRRLPVVDSSGKLAGVVSRRDLLSVFLRPDEDITADIRKVTDEILLAEPGEADVTMRNGIVTLTGTLSPRTGPHGDLIPLAIQLMWDVDGVVDIIDWLGEPGPPRPGKPRRPRKPTKDSCGPDLCPCHGEGDPHRDEKQGPTRRGAGPHHGRRTR